MLTLFHTLLTPLALSVKGKALSKRNPASDSLVSADRAVVLPGTPARTHNLTSPLPGGCGAAFTAPLSISLSLILMAASCQGLSALFQEGVCPTLNNPHKKETEHMHASCSHTPKPKVTVTRTR